MKTEELIETLALDLKPISRGALQKRLLRAAAAGGAVAFAIVSFGYGLRSDLIAALDDLELWRKLAFTLAVALFGFFAAFKASRPGVRVAPRMLWLMLPFAAMASLALMELAPLEPPERRAIWLGKTALSCPWSILLLAVPVLAALLAAMRHLAPTRPAMSGFAAGIAAGGISATLYGLHCPEWSASFVATWYVLGILASGILGATLGRRLLRW